jgi:PAS domain S-box-containing protein
MKARMTEKKSSSKPADNLRKRAGEKISKSSDGIGETSPEKMSSAEIRKRIQELHIHQIELEMQNEALRRSQRETSDFHRRYEELFNFAPVGYFTLDKKGHILETNVTGASILGFEKRSLIGESFHRFIMPEYLGAFQSHLQQVIITQGKHSCRLKFAGKDGSGFDALI